MNSPTIYIRTLKNIHGGKPYKPNTCAYFRFWVIETTLIFKTYYTHFKYIYIYTFEYLYIFQFGEKDNSYIPGMINMNMELNRALHYPSFEIR